MYMYEYFYLIRCSECGPRCRETTYRTRVTSTAWPSDAYLPFLAEKSNFTFYNISVTERAVLRKMAAMQTLDELTNSDFYVRLFVVFAIGREVDLKSSL